MIFFQKYTLAYRRRGPLGCRKNLTPAFTLPPWKFVVHPHVSASGRRARRQGCAHASIWCHFQSTALGAAVVYAERPRAERDDLEQSTGHHHVLEEVDHLVLVGEVAVE
jgi:hypothetical protein